MPEAVSILPDVMAGRGITFGAAARKLKKNPSTLWRWHSVGAEGPGGVRVKLAAAKLGSVWHTTEAALQAFIETLSVPPQQPGIPARSPAARNRASQEAAKKLQAVGC